MTDEWVDRYAGYHASSNEPTSDEDPSFEEDDQSTSAAPTTPEPTPFQGPSDSDGPTSDETEESTLLAGKYRSPEDLERAYQETSRESSRLARELAQERQSRAAIESLLERLAANQPSPTQEPPKPQWTEEDFHSDPVGTIERMIDHRARSERESAMREANERARVMHARLQGTAQAFTEVAQANQIPSDHFDRLSGYATKHRGVSALIEAGRYQEAAEVAAMLYTRDQAPAMEAERRQAATKRKAAYVEGGRTSRGPAQQTEPRELTREQIAAMSNEELDLHVANQLGGRLPEQMRLARKQTF